jgi:hypothetical protein
VCECMCECMYMFVYVSVYVCVCVCISNITSRNRFQEINDSFVVTDPRLSTPTLYIPCSMCQQHDRQHQ